MPMCIGTCTCSILFPVVVMRERERERLEIPSLSTYSEVCVPGCCMILFSNLFCVGVLSSMIHLSLCMKFTLLLLFVCVHFFFSYLPPVGLSLRCPFLCTRFNTCVFKIVYTFD